MRSRHGRGKRSSRPGIPYKAGYNPGNSPHELLQSVNQIDFEAYNSFVREHLEYSEEVDRPEDELESSIQEGSRFQRGMLDQPQFTDRKVGTKARTGQSKQKGPRKSVGKQAVSSPTEVVRILLLTGYDFETILHSLHLNANKTRNIVGGSDFYIGESDWNGLIQLAARKATNGKHLSKQLLIEDNLWDQLPLEVRAALGGTPDNLYDLIDPEVLKANDIDRYRWESTPYWMKIYFACSVAHIVYHLNRAKRRRNPQYNGTSEPSGSDLNEQRFIQVMCCLIPNAKQSEIWTIWHHAENQLAMIQRFAELSKGRVPTMQDLKLAAESAVQKPAPSGKLIAAATPLDSNDVSFQKFSAALNDQNRSLLQYEPALQRFLTRDETADNLDRWKRTPQAFLEKREQRILQAYVFEHTQEGPSFFKLMHAGSIRQEAQNAQDGLLAIPRLRDWVGQIRHREQFIPDVPEPVTGTARHTSLSRYLAARQREDFAQSVKIAVDGLLIYDLWSYTNSPRLKVDQESTLDEIVDPPLVEACKILYRKGIRTTWSSANRTDLPEGAAEIDIDQRSLSEQNRKIAAQIAPQGFLKYGDQEEWILRIPFVRAASTTVEEVHQEACRLAEMFEDQTKQKPPAPPVSKQRLYHFGGQEKADGSRELASLLGNKGANLAEMTNLGLPVPPGFTIPEPLVTEIRKTGNVAPELKSELQEALATVAHKVKSETGERVAFGDPEHPLFLAVRAGAKQSYPGEFLTFTLVGLHRSNLEGYARQLGNPYQARRDYLKAIEEHLEHFDRLVESSGKKCVGIQQYSRLISASFLPPDWFLKQEDLDKDVSLPDLDALIARVEHMYREVTGRDYPDSWEQLEEAVVRVAKGYKFKDSGYVAEGGAINIQWYVFGHKKDGRSLSGVLFSRNPFNGERDDILGQYELGIEGKRIVNPYTSLEGGNKDEGTDSTRYLEKNYRDLHSFLPEAWEQLQHDVRLAERHFGTILDMEIVIQSGRLYFVQCRDNLEATTPLAQVRILVDLATEGAIREEEAIKRAKLADLEWLKFYLEQPVVRDQSKQKALTIGIPLFPGVANGVLRLGQSSPKGSLENAIGAVYQPHEGPTWSIADQGASNFFPLFAATGGRGLMSLRGGYADHAAIVLRKSNRRLPYVIIPEGRFEPSLTSPEELVLGEARLRDSDEITLDGNTGAVYRCLGPADFQDSEITRVLNGELSPEQCNLWPYYQTLLRWIAEKKGVPLAAALPKSSEVGQSLWEFALLMPMAPVVALGVVVSSVVTGRWRMIPQLLREVFWDGQPAAPLPVSGEVVGPSQQETSGGQAPAAGMIPASTHLLLRSLFEQNAALDADELRRLLGIRIHSVEEAIRAEGYTLEFEGQAIGLRETHPSYVFLILKHLPLTPADVLWDLGMGYGTLPLCARMLTRVGQAKGVEIMTKRVEEALRAARDLGIDRIEFLATNICNLDPEDLMDGTVFYLYSPFLKPALSWALSILHEVAHHHRIRVVGAGPINSNSLCRVPWLQRILTLDTCKGIHVYESSLRLLTHRPLEDAVDGEPQGSFGTRTAA